jgi:hypothetical protein
MLKVPFACKHHCDAVFVGSGDDLIVFLRAARLNYTGHACLAGNFAL